MPNEAPRPTITGILVRIAAELDHPCMAFSGSGDVPAAVLRDAAAEIERLRAALVRLRDCDWVCTPLDRMDAVRDIARAALNGEDTRPHD